MTSNVDETIRQKLTSLGYCDKNKGKKHNEEKVCQGGKFGHED